MNISKILLSIFGIIVVIYFAFVFYQNEVDERQLRLTENIVQVKILELSCGKRDFIKLRIRGKEIGKRIYLSVSECDELRTRMKIGIKIDSKNNFVFAYDEYNDWSEAELYAIIILAAFFIWLIFYHGIVQGMKKNR